VYFAPAVAMAMTSLSLPPSISTLPPPQSPLLLRAGVALRLHSRTFSAPAAVPLLRFNPARCPALVVRSSAMNVASFGDDEADNGDLSSTFAGYSVKLRV